MPVANVDAERARKNRHLAFGLLAVSLAILGLMISVVICARSGLLGELIDHVIRLLTQ